MRNDSPPHPPPSWRGHASHGTAATSPRDGEAMLRTDQERREGDTTYSTSPQSWRSHASAWTGRGRGPGAAGHAGEGDDRSVLSAESDDRARAHAGRHRLRRRQVAARRRTAARLQTPRPRVRPFKPQNMSNNAAVTVGRRRDRPRPGAAGPRRRRAADRRT